MEVLTGEQGMVDSDAFCRCMHALSLGQRELLPASAYAVFPDSAFSGLAEGLKLRRAIWLALEDPLSSPYARAVAVCIVGVIIFSTVALCLETIPSMHKRLSRDFASMEAACVAVFTVELLLRVLCTPSLSSFFKSFLNAVDVLAVAPFYLELVVLHTTGDVMDASSASILRAMRLVRVFRLLKVGRYLAWLRVFGRTLASSLAPLGMLLFIAVLCVLFSSTLVYYCERGVWSPSARVGPGDEFSKDASLPQRRGLQGSSILFPSQLVPGLEEVQQLLANSSGAQGAWVNPETGLPTAFQSIPSAFWWCIITMTGVGYGDMVPATPTGKLAAVCTFFCGIVLCSVPISLISGNFHLEYEQMKRLVAIAETHAAQPTPNAAHPFKDALAEMETVGALPSLAEEGGDKEGGKEKEKPSAPPPAAADQPLTNGMVSRILSSWSEPFLRSAAQVLRNGRRKLMAGIKAKELVSRELATTDLTDFVHDIYDSVQDRGGVIVRKSEEALLK